MCVGILILKIFMYYCRLIIFGNFTVAFCNLIVSEKTCKPTGYSFSPRCAAQFQRWLFSRLQISYPLYVTYYHYIYVYHKHINRYSYVYDVLIEGKLLALLLMTDHVVGLVHDIFICIRSIHRYLFLAVEE